MECSHSRTIFSPCCSAYIGGSLACRSFDLSRQNKTHLRQLSSPEVATLINAQQNVPFLLSMRYNSGQLMLTDVRDFEWG